MPSVKNNATLSDSAVYVDDRRMKIIPNTLSTEEPGEGTARAVSAGAGAYEIVHGRNVEAKVAVVKFDIANTQENQEFIDDYIARADSFAFSTLKVVDLGVQKIYDTALLTNKIEVMYEAEGNVSLEWSARRTGV